VLASYDFTGSEGRRIASDVNDVSASEYESGEISFDPREGGPTIVFVMS
jgi:hypothetical protein